MDTQRKKKLTTIALLLGFTLLLTVTGIIIDATVSHAGYTPAPMAEHNCGYSTCTVYFNKAETEVIAGGDVAVAVIAAACAEAGTPLAGIACGAVGAMLVMEAQWAKAHGNCVKLRYGFDFYNGGFRFYPMQYACGTRPWIKTMLGNTTLPPLKLGGLPGASQPYVPRTGYESTDVSGTAVTP